MVDAAQPHDAGPGSPATADPGGDLLRLWCAAVEGAYPVADAEGWDQVGLHVGDPDQDLITGVLVSLDVTPAVLEEAAGRGANLIVAHHPLLFSPLARLTPQTAPGRLALMAARQGCAILAAHTNVDKAIDGTSHPTAQVLGLVSCRPLLPTPDDDRRGLGLVGLLPEPMTLVDLARRLAADLPSPHLRLAADDPTRVVRTVAICGGAGDSLIPDVIAGSDADVFITGDLKHHVVLDALTQGLPLIDAGHHATENPAMDAVVARLEARRQALGLSAPLIRSAISTDPWTDWTTRT